MRAVVALAVSALACSTATGNDAGADAAPECGRWNELIPSATQYECEGGVPDASGCHGDPSVQGSATDFHPLGCQAITTRTAGSDMRCQRMQCGCLPLACYCQTVPGDAGPAWVCPD